MTTMYTTQPFVLLCKHSVHHHSCFLCATMLSSLFFSSQVTSSFRTRVLLPYYIPVDPVWFSAHVSLEIVRGSDSVMSMLNGASPCLSRLSQHAGAKQTAARLQQQYGCEWHRGSYVWSVTVGHVCNIHMYVRVRTCISLVMTHCHAWANDRDNAVETFIET